MKVARTVLSGGKDGDNFKVLPIATKTRSPRVRALGLFVLVFSHGFFKRIEHIEDNV
ncbi:hypothetical protein [Bacillus cereus group sp. IBL03679]|uniref:hypothetical protein n=1 Tax=Bacillus cereus group sp. IBL03679 TaxID=3240095 RepID=UPI003D2F8986